MRDKRVIITVMSGADDGKVLSLDKATFSLGRHPDDDVFLPHDNRVSRHHARINREGSHYFIEDLGPEGKGSANGTRINDDIRNIAGKTAISSGDMILLGSVWVKFETR